jgi:hypothetical protein
MTLDQVKDTIAKLLNLAKNDGAAKGEVENALRFADRMMRQHHLTEDDIHEAAAAKEAEEYAREWAPSTGKKFCPWEFRLAQFVADFLGSVKHYYEPNCIMRTHHGTVIYEKNGHVKTRGRMQFYGVTEEAEFAAEMFNEWRLTIAAMARLRFGSCLRGKGGHYGDGFVAGMYEKLLESRRKDRLVESENALMIRSTAIAKRKKEEASNWLTTVAKIQLGKKKHRGRSTFDPESYGMGKEDGRKAQVTGMNPKLK